VEDSIAKAIVAALRLRLNAKDAKAAGVINAQGTSDIAAYELYLRGEYLLARRGASLYAALKLFEQATDKDPNFARAYAAYGMAASLLPNFTRTPSDSIIPLGLKAARRAIQLDPKLADAHLAMGSLLLFEYKWEEARKEYQRALEIEPNNATAHQWAGDVMYVFGKPRESLANMKRATELEPSSAVIHTDYAYALLVSKRYEEARVELAKSVELDSSLVFNESNLAAYYYFTGKYDSIAVIDRGRFPPVASLYRLAGLQKQGDANRARVLRDSIEAYLRKPHMDDDGSGRALLYAITGNADASFKWLNHMIEAKAGLVFSGGIPCTDLFRPLYSDPRWDTLLKRINAVRCQN
jgi:serine/threonine-protein kinase